MNATILLARHASHQEVGHVLSGRSEIALSDAGRAEAGRLAQLLERDPPVAIHSSPRARARETAGIVGERIGVAVEIAPALDEIDFAGWTGQSFAALADDPAWRHWNTARGRAAVPGGEDMRIATMRAADFIEQVDGTAGPVLCVSHADIIRGLVAHYVGLDADNLLRFDVDPASLTTLALHDGGGRLVALNERAA